MNHMFRNGLKLNAGSIAVLVAGLFAAFMVVVLVRHFYADRSVTPTEVVAVYPAEPPTGRLPQGVRPLRYAIDLKIIPGDEYFSGTATIEVDLEIETDFIWLHGRGLDVSHVSARMMDGALISGAYAEVTEGGVAKVTFAKTVKPGTLILQLVYEAAFSKTSDGLYKVFHEGRPVVFSQLQSIDARRVFPGFDEPRFKTPFDVSIIAPVDDVVIFNTPEVTLMPVDDGEALHLFATTQPLNSATLSFTVGALDVIGGGDLPETQLRPRAVPLRGITLPGRGGQMEAMLKATQPLLEAYEDYFGIAYPYQKLDLVAVPDFAWAGMENAGAISYGEKYIFVDGQTTTQEYLNVVDTHAHELAHQWFGNLVTPQWWDDVWLNESFATWIAGKMIAKWDPALGADETVRRDAHRVMRLDARPSARRVQQLVENNDDIMGAFSDIAYYKGGGVLEMFEAYVGEDDFREGIALFMKRHKDGTTTLDDFIENVSVGSLHPEIEEALRSFVTQPGVPLIDVSVDCSGPVNELTLIQSRYFPLGAAAQDETFWQVPVCYRTDKGRSCHFLNEKSAALPLGPSCPAFVVPNAGGSGYYLWALDDVALENLLDNLQRLTPMESETMAYNIGHWFRAGHISAARLFDLVEQLAALQRPQTDRVLIGVLRDTGRYVDGSQTRAALKARINRLYAGRALGLGFNPGKKEALGRSLLRDELVDFLVVETAETGIRKRLYASLGKSRISLKRGLRDKKKIYAHKRKTAILKLGVLGGGDRFAEALIDELVSGRAGSEDHDLLAALAATDDPKLGQLLLEELLLSGALRRESVSTLTEALSSNPSLRAVFWDFMATPRNLKAYLERLPESARYELVSYGSAICDVKTAELFEASIGNSLDLIPGGSGVYPQVLEAIDQCLTIKAAKAEEIAAALR